MPPIPMRSTIGSIISSTSLGPIFRFLNMIILLVVEIVKDDPESIVFRYSVQVKLMDSAISWHFAARHSALSMVVPLTGAATLSAGRALPGTRTNSLNPAI